MGGMSDKVNPHNLRVGLVREWKSKWKPSDYKEESEKNIKNNSNKNKETNKEER